MPPEAPVLAVHRGDSDVAFEAVLQRPVEVVESVDDATSLLDTDRPIAAVVSHGVDANGIDRLRAATDRPLVALVDEDPTPSAAIDAGADDVVVRTDAHDEWERLLDHRIERMCGARDGEDRESDGLRDPSLTVLRDALGAALDGRGDAIACVFDHTDQHRVVVETGSGVGEIADQLRAGSIDALPLSPDVRAMIAADYAAVSDGESRNRTVTVDDRPIEISTRPVDGTGIAGIAVYEPATTTLELTGDIRRKIERLHDVATQLDRLESTQEICSLAVDTASGLLDFDACSITEAVDGDLVPVTGTADGAYEGHRRMDASEGIAGETLRRGESILIDDITDESAAAPTDDRYRSMLSVPIGSFGVFQTASTEVGAYTAADRELAELLISHVAHAIERVRFEQTLTEERDRFAALFQNVPDAAIQYALEDGEPVIEAVNSAFVRLFGYDPEEVVGESPIDMLVPESHRDSARETYDAITAGERIETEVRRDTSRGTAPFLLRSAPMDSSGDRQHGYLIYTDISELIERERQLQRKNERLDSFASVVSHDLRNPLSIANGYLDVAAETGDTDHLETVGEQLDRMEALIEDLLTLARQGDSLGEVESVDLEALVEQSWAGVDTESATRSVGDLGTVEGDPDRLRQVFENLFRNAVFHGGPEVSVTVDRFEDGLYVADDGPGVPASVKDEVFEMGVSTEKGAGGTGFGLSIVSDIVDAHGWEIRVTDADSGGARFEIVGEDLAN